MSFYSEITTLILSKKIQSKEDLHKTKVKLCKKYKLDSVPPDSEILAKLPDDFSDEEMENMVSILRKKSMRTISGVAIVAVMTSPAECPHGLCIPCPGGPDAGTPQSYTGHEPAAMRGLLNDFDPYLQTKSRIDQLKAIGHPVDKIDFIIMGGTFTARNPYYQEWFVKRCLDALNHENSKSLEEAKKKNETSPSRCIGLTVETRPDWFRLQHADNVLNLGATRVELGIQTVFDDILNKMERGHTVTDSINATRIAKECGFKVCFHLMPGLPDSDEKRDIESFETIFNNSNFKPDMIKIYPTLTIKGTKLYNMWKKGDYKPLTTKKASKLVAQLKTLVPEWVRIQRIQRDVPSQYIDAGVDKSNLRQFVSEEMEKQKLECRCIRCREIGHKSLKEKIEINEDDISLNCSYYDASGGEEVFISLENEEYDALIGFLRLRNIANSHRSELQKNPCIIRELKVVGRELPIGESSSKALQHRGYGKELIDEAERICLEAFDKKHLFVLSGVGVKQYYRKLGFKDNGVYLSKTII
ncbi:MAG: tRNA uridine(34) 5-carboxymethylaminomethyl modification radical SAM/GNAT enzyme Elp3 [Thermoplasmatales archaeon]|nr:tRNA uridine(34) 5-carboxymethylaminomethyl modification radical SAM/GNAT enzyme Elp3 [Thermoplasmatales archaeon]